MAICKSLPYRSPIVKLLRHFCRSRDKWKARCKAAKQENKSLKYRLAKMKQSRDRWRERAKRFGLDSQEDGPLPKQKAEKKRAVGHRRPRLAQPHRRPR